jgi:hypothetical protein
MSEEPEVMLLSGERVNEALFEWIVDLLRKGHEIKVSEDDHVSIVPAVHSDLMFCIENSPSATRAILDDLLAPKTLH